MFWSKPISKEYTNDDLAGKVSVEAEGLYRSGKMHCAEAVLAAVKNNFAPELSDDVIHLAAGFGGGSGVGCICGAVSGGTIALGLVLKSDRKRTASLTKDLHKWFKEKHGVTCCRIIRANNDKAFCPVLTGEVAGQIAKMLSTR